MSDKSIKLVVIQKTFASYRKGIFDKLNDRYDFKVIHSKLGLDLDEIETRYSIIVGKIKYASRSTALYLFSLLPITRIKPHVIVHEFTPSILSLWEIFLLRKIFGYKIVLWGHVLNKNDELQNSSAKFKVRSWMIGAADAVLFYSNERKKIVNEILPSNKYFVANNALDTTKYEKLCDDYIEKGENVIKTELKINYEKVIVFIGRLNEEKVLIDIFTSIAKSCTEKISNIGFYIIGDGPEKSKIESKIKEEGITNIHLLGSIYDDLLSSKYLFVADLMLMPGAVGLAVNHSLSFYTPTVTFETGESGPFHGPEIEIIENYKTGYKAKNYDIADAVNFIQFYLSDKELQSKMNKYIKESNVQKTSLNHMEAGFVEAIDFCLKNEQ